jgi:hypothetical protein
MPVIRTDLETGHVLKYTITDPWKITDLLTLFPADIAYRDQAQFKVHTLINAAGAYRVPPGWLNTRTAPGLIHPNSGQFVVVGLHPTARRLLDVLVKIIHYDRMRIFETDDAALVYLREVIKNE